jgi:hypothetical protein
MLEDSKDPEKQSVESLETSVAVGNVPSRQLPFMLIMFLSPTLYHVLDSLASFV